MREKSIMAVDVKYSFFNQENAVLILPRCYEWVAESNMADDEGLIIKKDGKRDIAYFIGRGREDAS